MGTFEYQKSLNPVLDIERKFVMFSNNKVAQKAMIRHLLKDRALLIKSSKEKYKRELEMYNNFDDQFKFTFVRNPWDKVVSAFHYLQQQTDIIDNSITFDYFVKNILADKGESFDPHFNSQYKKVYYKGRRIVDFVGLFEYINDDWQKISKIIGCSDNLQKVGHSNHKHYTKYYTTETRDIIAKVYADDLLLGYTFKGVAHE